MEMLWRYCVGGWGLLMAGIEDRAPWLRPYDARKDNEVEKNRAEHVFTNLKTESDLREQYSAGLFSMALLQP